jgi:GT2 family glycosyltransferase
LAPVFSVVMLSRGRADYTSRSLDALSATLPSGSEVILVDDGSEDASVQQAFSEFKRANPRVPVKIIHFEGSVGAVRARNDAVKAAQGEYIALLDNDCIARSKNWLSGLCAALKRHPGAGVAGVRLVYPLKRKGAPPVIQCAGCVVTLSGRVGFRGRGDPADNLHFAAEEEVQAVISACWLTTRSLWNEIGGMDEAFSPCQFEDIDYCYRARELGRTIIYAPSVEMYHFENVTSGGIASVNYGALTARNSLIFRRKWAAFLEKEGAPPPSAVTWRMDIPPIRLEDNPALEVV